jgi:DNA-binding Xre family transcriptional regulator
LVISYEPLFRTLEEKGLRLIDLERKCEFSSATTSKFRKGEPVALQTICRICCFLNVPIEKVLKIYCD